MRYDFDQTSGHIDKSSKFQICEHCKHGVDWFPEVPVVFS